ncbi:MAG: hypothetical protein ABJF01_25135 [bacterium]
MRKTLQVALSACAIGCSGDIVDSIDHRAPPMPSIIATTRVVSGNGASSLEVSAVVSNGTGTPLQIASGPQCPLFVRIFPDSTGESASTTTPAMACSAVGALVDLAPGGSLLMTRTISADSLASYSPGTYGVNVAVTMKTSVVGVWAGAVRLPLGESR